MPQVCGGSLVSDLHILTAAGCVEGREARQLVAMLGLHSILSPHSAVANIRGVERSQSRLLKTTLLTLEDVLLSAIHTNLT